MYIVAVAIRVGQVCAICYCDVRACLGAFGCVCLASQPTWTYVYGARCLHASNGSGNKIQISDLIVLSLDL